MQVVTTYLYYLFMKFNVLKIIIPGVCVCVCVFVCVSISEGINNKTHMNRT